MLGGCQEQEATRGSAGTGHRARRENASQLQTLTRACSGSTYGQRIIPEGIASGMGRRTDSSMPGQSAGAPAVRLLSTEGGPDMKATWEVGRGKAQANGLERAEA